MLKIIPLGGLGEIGLNMMVFEYGDTIVVIDAGLMFPEDYMLGVDIVIPEMEYLRENRDRLKAVVLTHAHEDHIGAIAYLLKEFPVSVYGTPFTLSVVKNKLREFDILNMAELNVVMPLDRIKIGAFDIEFIRVSHSTVDVVGLAIRTPVGMIVHTGDFRINHCFDMSNCTDISRFAKCGEEGVLALLSDSTNAEKDGYTESDQIVKESLAKIVARSEGRVLIALFASNVFRIRQIIDIALKNNRKIVLNGRSIEQTVAIAKELGYLDWPEHMSLDLRKVNSFPDDKIMVITTGSQGEPMSALSRMATGFHKQLNIKKGDTVILSSKSIPGNEKAISNIINNLYRRGAEVVHDKIAKVHVSGHACREELKLMINLVKPKYFIPIHGEYRHLVIHARLAEKQGIPRHRVLAAENGNVICFDDKGAKIDGQVYTGRVLIDGKGIGDVGRSVLKERRNLSEDGLVVVSMIIDEETGIVLYGPELVSKGFVFGAETGYLVDDAQCVILEIVEEVEVGSESRVDVIRSRLQKALKQYFFFTIRRRPLILPIIIEV
ncbi:hydrolase (metallo-beta-lactamase superfamily) [Desulforapulum autotrophicum HRM2]|uniref:Ribonuclease J n=1 Tax=Desulforapulum autotrophicum (strain ATCC 43914 / DSM 3382 / VKM B-1955 / HRM2) TaxID=177437 RepID=C0QB02_DESAH|nr:ribonuclease J [Desulforapulum autotrophicum]ACN14801.1 hydrolase (metallo-beta-lactamase superfamily) [Desulforapulum autotrophicum HRM2]